VQRYDQASLFPLKLSGKSLYYSFLGKEYSISEIKGWMTEGAGKMGSTLQEQFLKMGLVDKKLANAVKKTLHQEKTGQGKKGPSNEAKIQAQQALAKKKERSNLLNQQKNKDLQEKETAARIRQLIDTNRMSMEGGETPYNFTDNTKIKRLFLPKEMADGLSRGDLAIIRQAGEYHIVPSAVAKEIQKFNKKLIVVFHTFNKSTSPNQEDPYAEFQVPDDLIW
jgi:uncharacterized protein